MLVGIAMALGGSMPLAGVERRSYGDYSVRFPKAHSGWEEAEQKRARKAAKRLRDEARRKAGMRK